jgi:hypothetical protein
MTMSEQIRKLKFSLLDTGDELHGLTSMDVDDDKLILG